MKYLLISGISIFIFMKDVYSQQDSVWLDESLINELEISSSEQQENLLIDYFEEINEDQVNINNAGFNDLLRIPGISNSDANKILEYKKLSGHIFSLFELFSIPGMDAEKLRTYFQFMCTENVYRKKSGIPVNNSSVLVSEIRSRLLTDIQPKKGFKENKYQGNQYKLFNRFKVNSGNTYRFGLMTEKDPGEKDYTDHTAFYIQVKDQGILKSFIAGGYNIEFGKGIATWGPYNFSKVSAVCRPGRNIVPYLSTDEVHYLRGTAVNLDYNKFNLTAFYSNRFKDASLDSTANKILSVPSDGYHRTSSELHQKGSYKEIISGAHLNFSTSYLSAGILFYNLNTDRSFTQEKIYPSGNDFNYFSFSYRASLSKLLISGETSIFRKSVANFHSVNYDISEKIKAVFTIRNTPPNYFSFLSSAKRNESGINAGVFFTSLPGNLIFYYDSYKISSHSFPFPLTGNELLIQYEVSPSDNISGRLRYKKEIQNPGELAFSEIIRHNMTSELTYKIKKSMLWKWRMDYSLWSESGSHLKEKGFAFYQEVLYTLKEKLLDLYGRITLFKTNSFNTRIYQYEKDLAGTFNMNPLFEEGTRWYIGININFMKGYKLQCKYSETYKPYAKTIGTGNDEIAGGLDNQFSLQIDLKI